MVASFRWIPRTSLSRTCACRSRGWRRFATGCGRVFEADETLAADGAYHRRSLAATLDGRRGVREPVALTTDREVRRLFRQSKHGVVLGAGVQAHAPAWDV